MDREAEREREGWWDGGGERERQQWCATVGPCAACYAVHARNAARYIALCGLACRVRSTAPNCAACGPLCEPRTCKPSPEFCVSAAPCETNAARPSSSFLLFHRRFAFPPRTLMAAHYCGQTSPRLARRSTFSAISERSYGN